MQIRAKGEKSTHREVFRRLACLFACLFAFVAVVAVLHHHGAHTMPSPVMTSGAPSGESVILSGGCVAVKSVPTKSDTHLIGGTGCDLCAWLSTALRPTSSVCLSVFAVFSLVTSLLLATRLAALCAVPAPRRGLRAPPAFRHA